MELIIKARCHKRFQHALTACCCVFKEVTVVGSNQQNYLENENTCSKRTLKTRVATRLNQHEYVFSMIKLPNSIVSQNVSELAQYLSDKQISFSYV